MGVNKSISCIALFSQFFIIVKTHVSYWISHFWHVSPQLSCKDTCKVWLWFKESNRFSCKIKNCAYGEINKRRFRNPIPENWTVYCDKCKLRTPNNRYLDKHVKGEIRHFWNFVIMCKGTNAYKFCTMKISSTITSVSQEISTMSWTWCFDVFLIFIAIAFANPCAHANFECESYHGSPLIAGQYSHACASSVYRCRRQGRMLEKSGKV